ncbi:MAG: hypothetical protein Kow0080_35360 [Candidatus Promineifilaceae bacterium]
MTEQTKKHLYHVVITLRLPESSEFLTANVTLVPTDAIAIGDGYKMLGDCTLAEIGGFADKLEADVKDAIQHVTLLELAKEPAVSLRILDEDEETVLDEAWLEAFVSLPVTVNADGSDLLAGEPIGEVPDDEPEADTETEESELVLSVPVDTASSGTVPTAVLPAAHRFNRVAGRQLPAGFPTWTAVDILIDESPLLNAQVHALSSMHREVAGILVGPPPEKQPDGRYLVHITDTIIAKHTVMQGASVTYTPESWRYIHDELARRYPEETAVIVGWYHTHPGFGIFLSGMDLFIHQNFFTQLWHVALVLDPQAQTAGFFCWDRYQSQVSRVDFVWPEWTKQWGR